MTFRGYHARLIAVTQNQIRQRRDMSLSVLMGIAGAFAGKDGGMEKANADVEKSIENLDEAMIEILGGRGNARKVLNSLAASTEGGASLEREISKSKARNAGRSTADMQRDIRTLDVLMSNLIGAPIRNSLGGYDGANTGPSSYDIGRVSVADQLKNV